MAGSDNILINPFERPMSPDINNLQSMLSRTIADLLRYGEMLRVVGTPVDSVRNVVLGGLVVSPSGSDVSISTGALLQDTGSLAPTPGALDSSYRIAINRSATTMVMPAPGADTYYLIEGQMVNTVTVTESRDLLNPTTGVFAPSLVTKQQERRITFQLLTGAADAPAPSGGNWVPIAIVRRPAGGGAVLATDIIDVRPLHEMGRERPALPTVREGCMAVATPGAATAVTLRALIDGAGGLRSADVTTGTLTITGADIIAPGLVFAADTWYYLYLAPWSALTLNPRFATATQSRSGVLVLTGVNPTNQRRNGGSIALPPPFGVVAAPAGSAYLVGAVRRNAANSGFITMQSPDLRDFEHLGGTAEGVTVAFLNPPTSSNAITPTNVPAGIAAFNMSVDWDGGAGAPQRLIVFVSPTGTAADFSSRFGVDDAILNQFFDVEVPVLSWGTDQFDLRVALAAPDAATDATLRLTRYRYV